MKVYNTKVTPEDIAQGIKDENGVIYSQDGKRLLRSNNRDLEKYTVKEGTEIICDGAFTLDIVRRYGHNPCPDFPLQTILLPKSLKAIGDYAFYSCYLFNISLPEGLEQIGKQSFYFNLFDELILPESLRYIGDKAFGLLSNIREIFIPKDVSFIGENPIYDCCNLANITIDERNRYFDVTNGVLCDKRHTRIIHVPYTFEGAITIPSTSQSCDRGSIPNHVSIDEVPVGILRRWKFSQLKKNMLEILSRPCGIKGFRLDGMQELVSVKITNNLYCNIVRSENNGYSAGKNLGLAALLYALGWTKRDLMMHYDMIEEVAINKQNYKKYEHRELALPILCRWVEDVADDDTGEVVQEYRCEPLVEGRLDYLGQIVRDYSTSSSVDLEHVALLDIPDDSYTKRDLYSVINGIFNVVVDEEGIDRLRVENIICEDAPLFMDMFAIEDTKALGLQIIEAYNALIHYDDYDVVFDKNRLSSDCQQELIPWDELVTEYFDLLVSGAGDNMASMSQMWNMMLKFMVSKGVTRPMAKQFVNYFCHIDSSLVIFGSGWTPQKDKDVMRHRIEEEILNSISEGNKEYTTLLAHIHEQLYKEESLLADPMIKIKDLQTKSDLRDSGRYNRMFILTERTSYRVGQRMRGVAVSYRIDDGQYVSYNYNHTLTVRFNSFGAELLEEVPFYEGNVKLFALDIPLEARAGRYRLSGKYGGDYKIDPYSTREIHIAKE